LKISQETKNFISKIGHDTPIANIRENINKLIMDIFTDEKGRPTIEAATNSIGKIRDVFFPMFRKEFSLFAFPIVEIESTNYFFRIEDFNLHFDDIIPDQLKIITDSKIKIDLEKMKRHGELNFQFLLDDITTKVKKLKFSFRKKTGIKYNDSGKVNIAVRDASINFGFTFKLKEDKVDKIEVNKISVDLNELKIDILESKHEVIDSILTTMFLPVLKAKLTDSIQEALYDVFQQGICCAINQGLKTLEEN